MKESFVLTKFTAVKLLVFPLLIALFGYKTGAEKFIKSTLIGVVAAIIVLPFYCFRYYIPTGQFFPSNEEWNISEKLSAARLKRDANIPGFIVHMFTDNPPAFLQIKPPVDIVPNLKPVWIDLWQKHYMIGPSTLSALNLGKWYSLIFNWLVKIGICVWIIKLILRKTDIWWRLGGVILTIGLIEILMQSVYIYRYPVWDFFPNRAMYVVLVTWAIGYSAANILNIINWPRWTTWTSYILFSGFMLTNHLLPVY